MGVQHQIKATATANVVVIGGGVIGLSIARELARQGVTEVLLIERKGLGAEASYAAGGMLAPQAEADLADDFCRLACASRDMYPALARALLEETGIDIELDTNGTLYLALDEAEMQSLERRFAWQSSAALPVEKLTAAEARALEPNISADIHGALRFPLDSQVENRSLLAALIAATAQLGVRQLTNTKVECVQLESGKVAGVTTTAGFVSAPVVVLAAGAWSSQVEIRGGANLRLPAVRIQPVRGQMICLQTVREITRHVVYSSHGYVVPRRGGRLLAGSTSEHAGFEKCITAGGIASILTNALQIVPALQNLTVLDTWSGLRPCSEDGLPVLGPCEVGGLFYATGHYRNGILLAPITAELITAAILGKVSSPFLGQFAPERFQLAGAA